MLPLWTSVTLLRLLLDGVADRAVDQPLGAEIADRLDADADLHRHVAMRRADRFELLLPFRAGLFGAEADLLELLRELLGEEVEHLLRLRRAGGVFDAGVDVLGVLAEDHHVHLLRMLHRRRHAREIAHRPQADVQIEHLPQRDVQRADAAADRRRQRALDADEVLVGTPRRVRPAASCRTVLNAFSPA